MIADAGVLRAINKAMVTQAKMNPGRKKGVATNYKNAQPMRKAVRKLFQKLRIQGFSKKACDEETAYEYGIAVTTAVRHRKGLK